MNGAGQVIAGASRRDRIRIILKRLHLLPMKEKCKLNTLTLISMSKNGTAPGYLWDIVNNYSLKRVPRSKSSYYLQIIIK